MRHPLRWQRKSISKELLFVDAIWAKSCRIHLAGKNSYWHIENLIRMNDTMRRDREQVAVPQIAWANIGIWFVFVCRAHMCMYMRIKTKRPLAIWSLFILRLRIQLCRKRNHLSSLFLRCYGNQERHIQSDCLSSARWTDWCSSVAGPLMMILCSVRPATVSPQRSLKEIISSDVAVAESRRFIARSAVPDIRHSAQRAHMQTQICKPQKNKKSAERKNMNRARTMETDTCATASPKMDERKICGYFECMRAEETWHAKQKVCEVEKMRAYVCAAAVHWPIWTAWDCFFLHHDCFSWHGCSVRSLAPILGQIVCICEFIPHLLPWIVCVCLSLAIISLYGPLSTLTKWDWEGRSEVRSSEVGMWYFRISYFSGYSASSIEI